jgi:hypothetical protein
MGKFTYSGAVLGAVDEETRSLDSFFFGVFVAIFVQALRCRFLQEEPRHFKIRAHFADILFSDICCLGYQNTGHFTLPPEFPKGTFSRGNQVTRYTNLGPV